MSKYAKKDGFLVLKKHFIVLFFRIFRLIVVLLLLLLGYYFCKKYFPNIVADESMKYIFLTIIIIIFNYEVLKLILFIIRYYNNLLIITKNHIIILEVSLVTKDNLEVIDPYKVTKVDAFSRGILSNIFGYGTLVIEQQRDSVREFRHTPIPYKIMAMLVKQREYITEDRRKKYIISEES